MNKQTAEDKQAYPLRLPKTLANKTKERADKLGLSFNEYVKKKLEIDIKYDVTPESLKERIEGVKQARTIIEIERDKAVAEFNIKIRDLNAEEEGYALQLNKLEEGRRNVERYAEQEKTYSQLIRELKNEYAQLKTDFLTKKDPSSLMHYQLSISRKFQQDHPGQAFTMLERGSPSEQHYYYKTLVEALKEALAQPDIPDTDFTISKGDNPEEVR